MTPDATPASPEQRRAAFIRAVQPEGGPPTPQLLTDPGSRTDGTSESWDVTWLVGDTEATAAFWDDGEATAYVQRYDDRTALCDLAADLGPGEDFSPGFLAAFTDVLLAMRPHVHHLAPQPSLD